MKEKIKAYCKEEYKACIRYNGDVEKATDRAFGAMMFYLNYCTDYDESVGKWWDDEMLPKFRELKKMR